MTSLVWWVCLWQVVGLLVLSLYRIITVDIFRSLSPKIRASCGAQGHEIGHRR